MKLETFFEKFDQFAQAPNAIEKMRELVLSLATSGKLINTEDGVGQLEHLGEHADLVMGQAPKGDVYNNDGEGTLFVKVGEFGDLYPVEEVWTTHPLRFARKGDVLICVVGATVGKLNLGIECAIGRSVAAIRPRTTLNTRYLYYSLMPYTLKLRRSSRGSAQGVIGKAKLNSIALWIPPLAEQKQIVAKVDELMALCDQLEEQQREREDKQVVLNRVALARFSEESTPANLNIIFHKSYQIPSADLRKAILSLAVRGKLVPQDNSDISASELVSAIKKSKEHQISDGRLRKSKECRKWSIDEAPYELPSKWSWSMLGEITDVGTGSTPRKGNENFWSQGEIPWVSSGSTSNPAITKGDALITKDAVSEHRLRLYQPGTLLVALYGQGKTRGQVSLLTIQATINQALAAICPIIGYEDMQEYIRLLLLKNYDEMRSLSAGGAQPNLNVQKVKEFLIPIPPIAEQQRIVAKVDQLMALVDKLEAQLEQSRSVAVNLMDAIAAELTKIQ